MLRCHLLPFDLIFPNQKDNKLKKNEKTFFKIKEKCMHCMCKKGLYKIAIQYALIGLTGFLK